MVFVSDMSDRGGYNSYNRGGYNQGGGNRGGYNYQNRRGGGGGGYQNNAPGRWDINTNISLSKIIHPKGGKQIWL